MAEENSIAEATRDAATRVLREVKVPAKRAVVFICQRCERRIRADDEPARRMARRIRKLSKEAHGKGAVRSIMTGCMSLCPRDAIAVAVVPSRGQKPHMYIADASKPKAAAKALIGLLAES